ncbi:hypothetical protein [[Bacillus] enclensis]|uniref:hypothetical protein n=1 Tax=[Bacillus] enclensis TaxID=1402860 RepID=UPI0018DCD723|nr:hypothetical protein [[Bacillus] enclensis]MBH9965378.1 hypothetical protein [[Bacillus] enclensis]
MYNIEKQETLYLQSEIQQLKKTLQRVKESYSYAEAKHYKDTLNDKEEEIKELYSQINTHKTTEHELIRDRSRFQEAKERLEEEILELHMLLRKKEATIDEQGEALNKLGKELLQYELSQKNLSASLTRVEDLNHKLSSHNEQLLNDNKNLVSKSDAMKAQIKSQKDHIKDLNKALSHSEETKKEILFNLISQTEELEKLTAERSHTLAALESSKEQLISAEKQNMQFVKEIFQQYEKTIEENEWWLSSQFADIDKRANEQEEKMEQLETVHASRMLKQNKMINSKFKDVEETFSHFLGEIDSLRETNEKLTRHLFEMKRMIDKQKRSKSQIIHNIPVESAYEHENTQSKNN